MNIKNVLLSLLERYERSRCVEHTASALDGFLNSNSKFVVHNYAMVDVVRKMTNSINTDKIVTLEEICGPRGFEDRDPIVFDNATLFEIFNSSLNYIQYLEKENVKLKRKHQMIKTIIDDDQSS